MTMDKSFTNYSCLEQLYMQQVVLQLKFFQQFYASHDTLSLSEKDETESWKKLQLRVET